MVVYFLFFCQKPAPRKLFSKILSIFVDVVALAEIVSTARKFANYSWHPRDRNGPKIIEIGAILAIFRQFEISRKVVVGQALSKSSRRIQKIDAHMCKQLFCCTCKTTHTRKHAFTRVKTKKNYTCTNNLFV